MKHSNVYTTCIQSCETSFSCLTSYRRLNHIQQNFFNIQLEKPKYILNVLKLQYFYINRKLCSDIQLKFVERHRLVRVPPYCASSVELGC